MQRKRTACCCSLAILISLSISYFLISAFSLPLSSVKILAPANSTLGFGTILAVSRSHSPRRASLLWAANLTDLDIVIPEQPEWTERDLQKFRAKEHSGIGKGSALAWMSHLNALRWFLNSSHETALIIEDDTDWDISIRQSQTPLLAAAIRFLLANDTTYRSPHHTNHDPNFWAPISTWDLLYPGHCDDIPSPQTYLSHPHLAFHDPTVPPHQILHPDTQNFLYSLALPSRTRLLHRAFWPFCTFAYAVNRRFALLILSTFTREKEGGISAFDVQLLEACRDGNWTCWSVAPELFHHTVSPSEISRADAGTTEDGDKIELPKGGTWNLRCGARDPGLWIDEMGPREEVKKLVKGMVERGECPLDERVAEKGWKGCEWGQCGAQS